MDPLSLAPFILSVIVISEKTGFVIKDLIGKYKTAPMTLSLIHTEITTVSDALRRLENLCCNNPDSISTRFRSQSNLVETFDNVLTGCVTVISCIEHELSKVSKRRPFQSIKWTGNIKFMLAEGSIKTLLQHLGGQRGAIQLLLQSLQVETMASMHQKQDDLTKMLRARMADNQSLRQQYPEVRPPSSIIHGSEDGTGSSTLSGHDAESLSSTTERSFDDEVIDSKAYRRIISQYEKVISEAKASGSKSKIPKIPDTKDIVSPEPIKESMKESGDFLEEDELVSSGPSSISKQETAARPVEDAPPLNEIVVELPADTIMRKPLDVKSVFSTIRSTYQYYDEGEEVSPRESYVGVDRDAVIASSSARFHLSTYERDRLDNELLEAVSEGGRRQPDTQLIEALLNRGAYVNAHHLDNQYEYPLQALCAWTHDADLVELLIRRGADVNATGGCRGNALAASCWLGAEQVVELLLRAGADPSANAIRSLMQSRQTQQKKEDKADVESDASSDYSITLEMDALPGAFLQSWDEDVTDSRTKKTSKS